MVRSYMFENKTRESRQKEREEAQVELRKQRRNEMISKRKQKAVEDIQSIPNYKQWKEMILGNDLESVYHATYEFRKVLSNENSPPIQEIVDSGLLPRIIELLSKDCSIYINNNSQFVLDTRVEAAWIVTNLASGNSEQTDAVISLGATKLLLDVLDEDLEKNFELVDQCTWALGNISGDTEQCRDIVIEQGGTDKVVELICKITDMESMEPKDQKYLKLLKNLIWMVSNLCRGNSPPPSVSNLKKCLDIVGRFVLMADIEILNDSLWAIAYICDADVDLADHVLKSFIIEKVYETLFNTCQAAASRNLSQKIAISLNSLCPCLRIIGNISTGPDAQILYLLDYKGENSYNLLEMLKIIYYNFDDHRKLPRVRREICWILSNICAGSHAHTEIIIKNECHKLLTDALHNGEVFVRSEAAWALLNSFSYLNIADFFDQLVSFEVIDGFKELALLVSSIPDLLDVCLSAFYKILAANVEITNLRGVETEVLEWFDRSNAIGVIEDLQESANDNNSAKAFQIIKEFFGGVEFDE